MLSGVNRFVALPLFVGCLISFLSQTRPEHLLVPHQELPLRQTLNGMDGALQILEDSRFTPQMIEEMWGNGDWSFVLAENDPVYKSFGANPPNNAHVRITDMQGQQLADETLERPLAKIETARLDSSSPIFLLTVDYSVGMGSYAGLTTFPVQVIGSKLQWVQATDESTGQTQKISLPKTLKSDWKLSSTAAGQDILSFYCRPDSQEDPNFVLHYARYHFDRARGWIKYERSKRGIWESDEPFPPRKDFP